MTITQMLEQSLVLSALGMAVVFAFLWIMIIFVSLTAKVIRILGKDQENKQANSEIPESDSANPSSGIIAAISAALNEYRKKPAE